MRSTPAASDLNSNARIRNEAITLFGQHGFAKTSVRAIAQAAGVSPGLIIHHFGSKEALRESCDEQVINEIIVLAREKGDAQHVGALFAELMQNPQHLEAELAYLMQSINDDSPAGRRMVDDMVAHSSAILKEGAAKGSMRHIEDTDALAVALVMQSIAMLTYRNHVQRLLGTPNDSLLDPAALARYGLPLLEVYTHGLYTDDSYLEATRQALAAAPTPAKEKNE